MTHASACRQEGACVYYAKVMPWFRTKKGRRNFSSRVKYLGEGQVRSFSRDFTLKLYKLNLCEHFRTNVVVKTLHLVSNIVKCVHKNTARVLRTCYVNRRLRVSVSRSNSFDCCIVICGRAKTYTHVSSHDPHERADCASHSDLSAKEAVTRLCIIDGKFVSVNRRCVAQY